MRCILILGCGLLEEASPATGLEGVSFWCLCRFYACSLTSVAVLRIGTMLCVHAAAARSPDVVVTRERGKNDKLMAELQQRGVNVLELPLVESAAGPDRYAAMSMII